MLPRHSNPAGKPYRVLPRHDDKQRRGQERCACWVQYLTNQKPKHNQRHRLGRMTHSPHQNRGARETSGLGQNHADNHRLAGSRMGPAGQFEGTIRCGAGNGGFRQGNPPTHRGPPAPIVRRCAGAARSSTTQAARHRGAAGPPPAHLAPPTAGARAGTASPAEGSSKLECISLVHLDRTA